MDLLASYSVRPLSNKLGGEREWGRPPAPAGKDSKGGYNLGRGGRSRLALKLKTLNRVYIRGHLPPRELH
jgi:hypothetical protein